MINQKKKKNKGFTLIELLITMGVISALGASIYLTIKKVQDKTLINQTMELSSNVLQKINEAATVAENFESFGTETTFSTGNSAFSTVSDTLNDNLLKSNIFPATNIADKYLINSYGNRVGLYFSKTPNLFYLSQIGLEPGACIQIGQNVQNYADAVIVQSGGSGSFVKELKGSFDREKLEMECLANKTSTIVFIKSKEK